MAKLVSACDSSFSFYEPYHLISRNRVDQYNSSHDEQFNPQEDFDEVRDFSSDGVLLLETDVVWIVATPKTCAKHTLHEYAKAKLISGVVYL